MRDSSKKAPLHTWLSDTPGAAVDDAIDRMRRMRDVQHVAIMPDVHLGQGVCIGSVIATRSLVYPGAVGGDIGCGMAAVAFDAEASAIHDATAARILRAMRSAVPIKRHARGRAIAWLERARLSDPSLETLKQSDGPQRLGTLGQGNHFVELQRDESDGRLWLMIHSGSRHLGQAIRDHHVARAHGVSFGQPYLDTQTPAGRAYVHDMGWARAYAELNRQAMMCAVATTLKRLSGIDIDLTTFIRTDHNHARRERHGGRWLWVHRKGAAPATSGQTLVIPGSMGTASYHAIGRGCANALRSSSHGAGRVGSRLEARSKISAAVLRRQMGGVYFDTRRARALTDEAPAAYRDIEAVMRAQRKLVTIHRRLRPVLVFKG